MAYYTDDSLFPENMEKLIDATFHEPRIASAAHFLAL
jgi:hypothetical protein